MYNFSFVIIRTFTQSYLSVLETEKYRAKNDYYFVYELTGAQIVMILY